MYFHDVEIDLVELFVLIFAVSEIHSSSLMKTRIRSYLQICKYNANIAIW